MKVGVGLRIFAISALLGLIAYVVTLFFPNLYESQLVLYFPQSTAPAASSPLQALGGRAGGSDPTAIPLFRNAFVSPLVGSGEQTSVGILQSRTCMEDVVQQLGLEKHWNLSKFRAIDRLKSRVSFSTEKSGFLSVGAQMESPKLASEVVSKLFDHLQARSRDLTLDISKKNRSEVEKQVEEGRQRLDKAQAKLRNKMLESPMANIAEVQRVYFEAYGKLNEATVKAEGARRQLALIENGLSDLLRQGGSYPGNIVALASSERALDKLVEELQVRRQALSDVRQSFTEDSPEFKAAAQRVESVEKIAKDVTGRQQSLAAKGLLPKQAEARGLMAMLEGEVTAFRRTLDEYEKNLQKAPGQFIDTESARAEFMAALERLRQLEIELDLAKLAETRDPSRFEVVDAPVEVPEAVSPRRLRIAGAIALLAFLVQAWPLMIRRYAASEAAKS